MFTVFFFSASSEHSWTLYLSNLLELWVISEHSNLKTFWDQGSSEHYELSTLHYVWSPAKPENQNRAIFFNFSSSLPMNWTILRLAPESCTGNRALFRFDNIRAPLTHHCFVFADIRALISEHFHDLQNNLSIFSGWKSQIWKKTLCLCVNAKLMF